MSDVYNPETQVYEKLESLELQARQIVQKRDEATSEDDRQVYERQLQEIEQRIESLKKRFR